MLQSDENERYGALRSKLPDLIRKRELEENRRIHQYEIAEATGLRPNTISRWMSPKPLKRLDEATILPLCNFFRCQVGDLIFIDYSYKQDGE